MGPLAPPCKTPLVLGRSLGPLGRWGEKERGLLLLLLLLLLVVVVGVGVGIVVCVDFWMWRRDFANSSLYWCSGGEGRGGHERIKKKRM